MNKFFELIANILSWIASLINAAALTSVKNALLNLAHNMHDRAGKISDKVGSATGMSRTDALTLLSSTLAIVSNAYSGGTFDSYTQRNATAALVAVGYVSDMLGHYEKVEYSKDVKASFIDIIESLISEDDVIKISKSYNGTLEQVIFLTIETQGLKSFWDECCEMEIILKDNRGTIKLKNFENIYNMYKARIALTNLTAFGIAAVNVAITLYSSTSAPTEHSSTPPSQSPSAAPTFNQTHSSTDLSHEFSSLPMRIAFSPPYTLLYDSLNKIIFREQHAISVFLKQFMVSLKKDLNEAISDRDLESGIIIAAPPTKIINLLDKLGDEDAVKMAIDLMELHFEYLQLLQGTKAKNQEAALRKSIDTALVLMEKERMSTKELQVTTEKERDEVRTQAHTLTGEKELIHQQLLNSNKKVDELVKNIEDMKVTATKNGVSYETTLTDILKPFFKGTHSTIEERKELVSQIILRLSESPINNDLIKLIQELESTYNKITEQIQQGHDPEIMSAVLGNHDTITQAVIHRVDGAPSLLRSRSAGTSKPLATIDPNQMDKGSSRTITKATSSSTGDLSDLTSSKPKT